MECHQCGACCTAISISSQIPGMGPKPSGIKCIHLVNNLCGLFGKKERPQICTSFQASEEFCGKNAEEAFERIYQIEEMTR